ncbi:MAG TPA: xanthine dehydrogenase family protein molybdopterin-binding subunit [Dehalococcoidia bacterium]|nr:xanthine dehydrogenase family protein molybdopterin-binding subunit [Dehalococcoidia bacterium]
MTYVGQPVRRFEDHRLLTGQGSFVDDMKLPGLLHAVVLRSLHAHATIRSIDVSGANRLPGVVAVITAADIQDLDVHMPTRSSIDDVELTPPRHPVLASDKVCYVGQAVALIIAEDPYTAADASEQVLVDYEVLPAVTDPYQAMEEGAAVIHSDLGSNVSLRTVSEGGDLDAAFAQADHVVRQTYQVQRLAPAPMEPRGLIADYDSGEDLLTVWDSTQHPHDIRENLVQLLGRTESGVRVVAPDVGGGFGEKGCLFPEEVLVPYLAILLGRPIKWVENRQENMTAFHGRGHSVEVEAAASSDGIILGIRVRIVADLGAYYLQSTPTIPVSTSHRLTGPYLTPAMSVEVQGVVTNKPPTGAYRGAGGPEAAFCMERTIDLIAQDLSLDPAEVRRRNFIPPGAFPYETPTGITYDSGEYESAFDRALELSEYDRWRERARQQSKDGDSLIGVGVATVVKGSGARVTRLTENARVIVSQAGEVTVHTGVSPHGQGTETTFAQITADALGVTPAQVQVLHSDTGVLPTGGGTGSSRGLIAGGTSLHVVLQEARQKLMAIAAHLLDCPQEDVVLQDHLAFSRRDPQQTVPFARLAEAAHTEELLPPGQEPGLDFQGSHTLPKSPYAFGAHVAVVEVSRETGAIKILKYVGVHDSGTIINPMLTDGQVHGALAQGIGQALLEDIAYSPEGQPLAGSLMDYALPRADNMPDFTLDTLETPSPLTPLGVKGIGELPTLAAPAAVANAVMDALSQTGVRHIDTPLTPEKVWRALNPGSRS